MLCKDNGKENGNYSILIMEHIVFFYKDYGKESGNHYIIKNSTYGVFIRIMEKKMETTI